MDRPLAEPDQMTIDEFLSFYDSRPDGEKWELVEGQPVMSPTPTEWHQTICTNIPAFLHATKRATNASWYTMVGVGTVVPASPRSLPQPDVFVKEAPPTDKHTTKDALVIFEVLSRSNGPKDRAWRKRVYGSVPDCQHYVAVSTKTAEVIRHGRAANWRGTKSKGLEDSLRLDAIDTTIPLGEIYLYTPIE